MTAVRTAGTASGARPLRLRARRAYGITAPGTYATIPAWWSRERWRSQCHADLHADAVTVLRREVGRRGPVSVNACWALAVALSACADSATGRNAMPGTAALTAGRDTLDLSDPAAAARLEAATGYGRTTLQKAARVLAARGWIVLVRAGKNRLTGEERRELRDAGSTARQRRNVWACTIPTHLRTADPRHPADPEFGNKLTVEKLSPESAGVDNLAGGSPDANSGCALPTTRRVGGTPAVSGHKIFTPDQASKTGAARQAPTQRRRRTYHAHWRTVRLATDLRARVYWLRNTPHRRIMPALDTFAKAGWSAADVQRELDRMLAGRGWEVPSARVATTRTGREHRYPLRCPWGYLAMLLRTLEPTDLIAQRKLEQALRAVQLAYERARRTGPECAHGEPAGDVPSPIKAILACPLCRRDVARFRPDPDCRSRLSAWRCSASGSESARCAGCVDRAHLPSPGLSERGPGRPARQGAARHM